MEAHSEVTEFHSGVVEVHPGIINAHHETEVGKETLKSNSAKALSNVFSLKSNATKVLRDVFFKGTP